MRMKEKGLMTLLIIVGISSGLIFGVYSNTCFHEIGHYAFAYLFNKSVIKQFSCNPQNYLSAEALKGGLVLLGDVSYYGEPFQVFPFYQALIITIMGPVFQAILFVIFLFLFNHVLNKKERDNRFHFEAGFFVGALISSVNITLGWIEDAKSILLQFTSNISIVSYQLSILYYIANALYYLPVVYLIIRYYLVYLPPKKGSQMDKLIIELRSLRKKK